MTTDPFGLSRARALRLRVLPKGAARIGEAGGAARAADDVVAVAAEPLLGLRLVGEARGVEGWGERRDGLAGCRVAAGS